MLIAVAEPASARPPSSTHVDDDDGDVVAAAALVGEAHQLRGGVVGIGEPAQHRGDAILLHLVEEAVGAQHVAVAGVGDDRVVVDPGDGVDAEGPGDDVALRVGAGLLRA